MTITITGYYTQTMTDTGTRLDYCPDFDGQDFTYLFTEGEDVGEDTVIYGI